MGQKKIHTELCRVRMMERLGELEAGQDRLKRQKERADHWVAGHVEEGDLSATPSGPKDINKIPKIRQPQEDVCMEQQPTSGQAETCDSQIIIDDGMTCGGIHRTQCLKTQACQLRVHNGIP